jgi:hypothetical protein
VILPAGLEIRSVLGKSLSYSEANTLSGCENRHALTYGRPDRERPAASWRMDLGTDIHSMWGHWWLTGDVRPTENDIAKWVMDRYAKVYGAQRNHGLVKMLAHEVPFAYQLADGTWVFGWIDGLIEVTGMGPELEGLWGAELKSTSAIDNILHLEHSLQLPTYVIALQDAGYPVRGILLDVAKTDGKDQLESQDSAYKRHRAAGASVAEAKELKKTDRLSVELPLDESFRRTWRTFTPEQLAGAREELESAAHVRDELAAGRRPRRNVSPFSCKGCQVIADCFGLTVQILDGPSGSAQ